MNQKKIPVKPECPSLFLPCAAAFLAGVLVSVFLISRRKRKHRHGEEAGRCRHSACRSHQPVSQPGRPPQKVQVRRHSLG